MATYVGCASAVLGAPGCNASGSISELAPIFLTSTVTVSGPPHEAAGAANPEIVRSGSEYPSGVYAGNSRPSRHSKAASPGRRGSRPFQRFCRVSHGNTEHLPAAEGPRPPTTLAAGG